MTRKVLFIMPSAYSLGGVQTWLDYIIPGLALHEWRALLVLTVGKHHDPKQYLKHHPIKDVLLIENRSGSLQGRVNCIENLINQQRAELVVSVNIVDVYQAVNNLRKNSCIKTKVIASMHGIHPGLIGDFTNYRDTIDAVVSTNRLAQSLVTDKTGIEPFRSLYAAYGVPIKTPKISSLNREGNLRVAYVGRLEEDQKRLSDLLKVFSIVLEKFPNIKVLIAGNGEELPSLMSWLDNEIHSERVDYLGVLNEEELELNVYQNSDVLLLTSHWETGPIVAWEAMNNGLLVVSSKYIGHKEENSLIDGENCLLFNIGDIDGAVNKLEMAFDYTSRTRMVERASIMLQKKYSEESSVMAWANCFNDVMSYSPRVFKPALKVYKDKGKLSFLFGQRFGEFIRRKLGIEYSHQSIGSEWPHSYSGCESESAKLIDYINKT